ncbi:MAG: hypothetical protein MJE77_29415 [Proteobacteria bacterium]|nr:hypothetical protein [Pseudomonadota bacterium]
MPRNKSTANAKRNKPPPKVTIRRNAASAGSSSDDEGESRPSIRERLQEMGGTHAAAGAAAGTVGTMLGVFVAGMGWIKPKNTAGILLGTGAATTTAGYLLNRNHLMAAGTGLAAAGTYSLINQYSVDAYEALEEKDKKKTEEREKAEKQKLLAAAREAAKHANQRNASEAVQHLRIVDADDEFEDVS